MMNPFVHKLFINTIELICDKNELFHRNIELILTVFTKGIQESDKPKASRVLNEMSKHITRIIGSLIDNNYYSQASEYTERFYQITLDTKSDKCETTFELSLDPILSKMINEIRNVRSVELVIQMGVLDILMKSIDNGRSDTIRFFESYAYIISDQQFLSAEEQKYCKEELVERVIEWIRTPKVVDNKLSIFKSIILGLIRASIQRADQDIFSLVMEGVYWEIIRLGPASRLTGIIFTTTCYLYYISFKEHLATEKSRIFAGKAMDIKLKSGRTLLLIFHELDILLWKFYSEVKSELDISWELIPREEVKMLILGNVVNEFFVLVSCIKAEKFNFELNEYGVFDEQVLYTLLQFFEEGKLKGNYQEAYSNFQKWMGYQGDDLEENSNKFAELLLGMYKAVQFEKLYKYDENEQEILRNKEKISGKIIQLLEESPYLKTAKRTSLSGEEFRIGTGILPISYLIGELGDSSPFANIFERNLESVVVNQMILQGLSVMNFFYTQENKLKELLGKLEELEVGNCGWFDVKIGDDNKERFFFRSESVLLKELQEFDERVLKFENKHGLYSLYMNSDHFAILYNELSVRFRTLSDLEISERMKSMQRVGDQYEFPVSGDTRIYLTKDEVVQYLTRNYTVVEASLILDISVENTGAAVAYTLRYD